MILWDLPVFPENRGGLGVGWLAKVDMRQVRGGFGAVQFYGQHSLNLYDRSRRLQCTSRSRYIHPCATLLYCMGPLLFLAAWTCQASSIGDLFVPRASHATSVLNGAYFIHSCSRCQT
jgi:hypothetical protein